METSHSDTLWIVNFSSAAAKQVPKLPAEMQERLLALTFDLEHKGRADELAQYDLIVGGKEVHHCHLNSGRPRYVVVWKVLDREVRITEIRYVGPHGSVNYSRFK